jgi:hypothetical protein
MISTVQLLEKTIEYINKRYVSRIELKRATSATDTGRIDCYFPAPLIGLTLQRLRDLKAECFTPLRIICSGIAGQPVNDSRWTNQFTIWLPTKIEEQKIEEQLKHDYIWDAPDIECVKHRLPKIIDIIARYVAAVVVGRAVSFAPKEILLDYYSEETRNQWGQLIDSAIAENGGPVMEIYATQIGCEPSKFRRLDVLKKNVSISPSADASKYIYAEGSDLNDKRIIGIDIGGTTVRLASFPIRDLYNMQMQPSKLVTIPKETIENERTKGSGGAKTKWTAQDFVKFLKEHSSKESFFLDDRDIVAIGVSLAAPVGKNTGRPLATSGPLGAYFGVESLVAKANPIEIHKIDLENALSETAAGGKRVVKVINDGDADIKDTETPISKSNVEGVTVELKAGTGIAVAVRRDGDIWELNAESAKAILNLLVSPDLRNSPEERFQQGCLGGYCSKNGIKRLTDYILFTNNEDENFKNPGKYIGSILEKLIENPQENLSDISAQINKGLFEEHIEAFKNIKNDLNAIYNRALLIYQLRKSVQSGAEADEQRLKLVKALGNLSGSQESQFSPDPGDAKNQTTVLTLPMQFNGMNDLQWFALGCAWKLGRWLADAIALIVDIFDAREVCLAGGPLSGATGLFITASAETALVDIYGFDLEVEWANGQSGDGRFQPIQISRYRIRDTKRLRLRYPPESGSDISGARGAAKAAYESWIVYTKQDQLRYCRDWVQTRKNKKEPFFADHVLVDAGLYKREENYNFRPEDQDKKGRPIMISVDDVVDMLAKESAPLGLSRTVTGEFVEYRYL